MFGVKVENDKITFKFIVADIKSLEMKAQVILVGRGTDKPFKNTSATKEKLDVVTSLQQL